jgi:hypothetical protein
MLQEYFKGKSEDNKNNISPWWQPAVAMVLRLSVWIAGPIIIALYLGNWLDNKYNSAPKLLLLCIAIAFITSMIGLVKNTIVEYRKISELSKQDKSEPKDKKIVN